MKGSSLLKSTVCCLMLTFGQLIFLKHAYAHIFDKLDLGSKKVMRLTGDLTGGYHWGRYSTIGQTNGSHSGVGIDLTAGLLINLSELARLPLQTLKMGLLCDFAFPQIAPLEGNSSSSFSYKSFGLFGGMLWNDLVEPFIFVAPWASLTQSSKYRLGSAMASTDVSYRGISYGAGMKVYVKERVDNAPRIGVNFTYSHEQYGKLQYSSEIESLTDRPPPAYSSNSVEPPGQQTLSGDSFQLGLFVGI